MASVHNPLAIAVKICSYNMHGFKNGLPMARELCKTHDLILLQEHWLLKNNLDKLDSIDRDFMSFNLSSMNAKSASGIMIGRPFGGVGILWRKNLANCIEILEGDENDGKFLSIMLHSGTYDIVITCVYFPCLSALNEYTISSSAIISHIDSMLTNYPTAKHIIAGDFNFECTNNIGFNLFSEVVKDYGLYACDELHVNKVLGHTYTYGLDYKSAIKKAAQDFEQNNASELNKHLINKDSKSFWKCWNANYRKSLVNTNIIDEEMANYTKPSNF